MAGPCVGNQHVIGVGFFQCGIIWAHQTMAKAEIHKNMSIIKKNPQFMRFPFNHMFDFSHTTQSEKVSQSQKEPLWHELISCWLRNVLYIISDAGASAAGDNSHMVCHVLRKHNLSSFMPCPLQIHRIFSSKIV